MLNERITDNKKFNQDFQELLKYSKTLNEKLHSLKVKESERSLLISGSLIALTDKAFLNSYKLEKSESLANLLVNKINEKLTSVSTKHIKNIIASYSFIKNHTILAEKEGKLKEIIDEIDEKINSFIKNYKYFDVLGQFYIEFLRYANNDKGLGIVLTPHHITELFCEIADINKNSRVLDTCSGTGGFLISAMQKMIGDTKGDKKLEKKIKESQILGVELQHDIYALLCSNMYIHGDGRSNLIKGNCFDPKIKESIAEFKPNVAFLNPPYKTNINDKEEIEFVLNNLEQLEKGSYCIAIIPLSQVLHTTGRIYHLKKKLLQENTLDAVFTMPTELFYNSKVNVTTCIIVVKAKESHPKGYKTYFGYWKQDGFVKRKKNGRADHLQTWLNIKKKWIDNYKNRDNIAGHSIKNYVTAKDEWCVEVYMETKYDILNDKYFENIIINYISYLLVYFKIPNISSKPFKKENIILNTTKWEYISLDKLFKIESGKGGNIYNMEKGEKYPYISATSNNNGCIDFIESDENDLHNENTITINRAGSVGETFYQNYKYVASKDRVRVLIPKFKLNIYIGMFLIGIIRLEKYRFNYGRTWGTTRIKNSKIKIPITSDNKPDWDFMEKYIKSLSYSSSL